MMDMIQALAARDRGNGGPCRISPFRGMVQVAPIHRAEADAWARGSLDTAAVAESNHMDAK
jgi:hypothetical protein